MNTDHDINTELRQNVIYAASHLVWAIEYDGADAAKHIADALDRFDNDVEALRQQALLRHSASPATMTVAEAAQLLGIKPSRIYHESRHDCHFQGVPIEQVGRRLCLDRAAVERLAERWEVTR